jgi:hypothetical protein
VRPANGVATRRPPFPRRDGGSNGRYMVARLPACLEGQILTGSLHKRE